MEKNLTQINTDIESTYRPEVAETPELMTFDEVGNVAWEMGGESIKKWEHALTECYESKAEVIGEALSDYSTLYGIPAPQSITVDLFHNPIANNSNGGPRSNFDGMEERFPAVKEMGDVSYRLADLGDLMTEWEVNRQMTKILHEVQHQNFQGHEFNQMVKTTIEHSTQAQTVIKRMEEKGLLIRSYANEPVELITTYLESIVDFAKSREVSRDNVEKDTQAMDADNSANVIKPQINIPTMIFRSSPKMHGQLLEIEAALAKEGNGPTKYIDKWREVLKEKLGTASIIDAVQSPSYEIAHESTDLDTEVVAASVEPDEDSSAPATAQDITQDPSLEAKVYKINVYELGEKMDPALVQEYLSLGRKLDGEFVVRLLELAEITLNESEV